MSMLTLWDLDAWVCCAVHSKREVRERLLGRHTDGLDNVLYELVAYCWGMEEGVQPQMVGV